MNDFEQLNEDQRAARPTFLKVLCILSFIALGFSVLSGLSSVLSGPQSDEAMLAAKVEMSKSIDQMRELKADYFVHLFEQLEGMLVDTNDHHALATSLNILITLIGFFAVYRMWHGYRQGFFVYIAYCLSASFVTYAYVSPNHIPSIITVFTLIFSGLFILLYSRNLHWMR